MSRNGHDKGVSKVLPPILVAKTRRSPVSDEWINLGGAVPFKDGTGYNVHLLDPIPENWDRKFVVLMMPVEPEE